MNDYLNDEYYEDEFYDEEGQTYAGPVFVKLCKAKNGQLYVRQTSCYVTYYGYNGQETSEAWETRTFSFSEAIEPFQNAVIEIGKGLQPGEVAEVTNWLDWIPGEEPEPDEIAGDPGDDLPRIDASSDIPF